MFPGDHSGTVQVSGKSLVQDLIDQRALTRAGNTCDRRQSAFGEIHRQGLHRMDGTGGQMDPSLGKKRLGFFVRTTSAFPERKGPIREWGSAATASTVPWAMT